ncbi:MAG: hypothetical protein CMD06_02280 [Flavobacteriales bacterium]|nr:hypothetical protein [Flavobacteriales bacterium]
MKKLFILIFTLSFNIISFAQNNSGQFYGDFDLNMQTYSEDRSIGAEEADEILLNNAYLNINYRKGNLYTGLRYESYLNALLDFDKEYQGNGIAYKYLTYKIDNLEITAGNYYDQIGSGLIFRSYENKRLGIDNSMDGVKLKYFPLRGLELKSFIGKSRTYFSYSDGIIRGVDINLSINDIFEKKLKDIKTKIILGQGIVSRYQKDNNPKFNLPQNVAAYSTRVTINYGKWKYFGEFATKLNDPIGALTIEENNYAKGSGIINSITYSKRGLGISAEMHRVDHMEFRSVRTVSKEYIINYIPALSKQHTYTLLGLYPCATQSEGEFGMQFDVFYKIKKGTLLGGKYGTKISLNFSRINALSGGNSFLNDSINHTPAFISIKDEELYFSDLNIEIYKKINRKLRSNFVLASQYYNKDVLEGKTRGTYGIVKSIIGVVDVQYRIKKGHTIKIELQELLTEQGDGAWSMGLLEYTISPNWFFAIQDMYNWGNKDSEKQLHYANYDFGYIKGATRIAVGYGKKRAGIFCVGGVCKEVPSSNGFNLSISTSF